MNKFLIMLQILLIALLSFFSSCGQFREKKITPNEFLNHTVIKKERYSKDSLEILIQLKIFLSKHEDFFYNKAYFDKTLLIIDTIIYSPDFNKLAVFVITKNPMYRQPYSDGKNEWYYDATCYLGLRQSDTISLSWWGPNFTNSTDEEELSLIIRDSYFTEQARGDTIKANTYKYNLNDVRFWGSYVWNEIEEEEIKKKEFELEKINHPENVFEPKH
ncbi:MAG: hypothetical protein ABI723_23760 [Bacteroidia bacterium]